MTPRGFFLTERVCTCPIPNRALVLTEDANEVINLQCLEGMIDRGFRVGEILLGVLRAEAAATAAIREDPVVDHGEVQGVLRRGVRAISRLGAVIVEGCWASGPEVAVVGGDPTVEQVNRERGRMVDWQSQRMHGDSTL